VLDEIIDQVRRLHRGIPVNDETLAVDVVKEVGADGNFLTQMHTLNHLRSTQWQPKLISRIGFEKWQAAGSTTLLDRGREKLQQILKDYQANPIPDDEARQIQDLVDRFE
jgi:trimethylamine--corrinoid protein Co-methyltransferase